MQIALLSDGIFPFVMGGMQKHTYYLTKYLAQAGVDVDLYFTYPPGQDVMPDLHSLFTAEEVEHIRIQPIKRAAPQRFPGHYVWESYKHSERIWDVLRHRLDVDFIYAQGFSGWKAMEMKKERPDMPKIGVNFHGFEMWQKPATFKTRLEHWLLRPFVRKNLKLADVVLVLGHKLTPLVSHLLDGKKTALESANGVTTDWLTASIRNRSQQMRFVFMGRYERRKGIEELHATIKQLLPDFNFQFDIVGPIPTHLQIRSDRVKYWGLVREERTVRSILAKGDVLVCPSYAEGMPTVILEAMASGLAIIATNVGAVGDLVSEDNGWIIPPGETAALQSAMIAALTDSNAALSKKRAASCKRVRNAYLWQRVAAKTIEGIESVV
ncbi:MAG: glycosyltransferase family 4 protein [Bacteroidota bacterium]